MPTDFSVIIPTFRRPTELREAIESVLAQEGATLQLLIVDDCPDGSAQPVAAAFEDPRIAYLRNPSPSGGRPARVRNIALPLATGDVIHFLDDDDRVPEGTYTAAKRAFDEHPEIGVVFGRVVPFGVEFARVAEERAFFARAERQAAACALFGRSRGFAARMFFGETMIVCGAALIRRRCVLAMGGFDPEIPIVEDVEFYARAIRRFGARFLDRVTLHYRIGPSLMHRPGLEETVRRSYHHMLGKYRAEWGWLDFQLMRLFARTALKLALMVTPIL